MAKKPNGQPNGGLELALTFDDVLLKPGLSEVLPSEVDIRSHITRSIGFSTTPASPSSHPPQRCRSAAWSST